MDNAGAAPMVSVVVCVYNCERFLGETIESALGQTYFDWELIAVDDGSTDGSAAVLDRYAALDPRIRVVRQQNGGAAAALDAGLRVAKGTYVALLDQDDLWERDKMEVHIEALERRPGMDLTFSWFRIIDERGNDMGVHSSRYRGTIDFAQLLRDFVIGASSNVVIRRAAIERAGGVDLTLPRMYDLDLFLRIALLAKDNLEAIPRDLMKYRRHDLQISRSVEPLQEEWGRALEKLRTLAPREVALVEKQARSNMQRYFARICYEGAAYRAGLRLLGEGFSYAPGAFLTDPRNWVTGGACLSGLLVPPQVQRGLERLAGFRRS